MNQILSVNQTNAFFKNKIFWLLKRRRFMPHDMHRKHGLQVELKKKDNAPIKWHEMRWIKHNMHNTLRRWFTHLHNTNNEHCMNPRLNALLCSQIGRTHEEEVNAVKKNTDLSVEIFPENHKISSTKNLQHFSLFLCLWASNVLKLCWMTVCSKM